MGVQGLVSNPVTNNGESCGDIQFIGSNIKSCDVPAHMIPSIIDEIPILAVIAAFILGMDWVAVIISAVMVLSVLFMIARTIIKTIKDLGEW
mgnify:CR=1 FL=1